MATKQIVTVNYLVVADDDRVAVHEPFASRSEADRYARNECECIIEKRKTNGLNHHRHRCFYKCPLFAIYRQVTEEKRVDVLNTLLSRDVRLRLVGQVGIEMGEDGTEFVSRSDYAEV